jgi:hypothetical protein
MDKEELKGLRQYTGSSSLQVTPWRNGSKVKLRSCFYLNTPTLEFIGRSFQNSAKLKKKI